MNATSKSVSRLRGRESVWVSRWQSQRGAPLRNSLWHGRQDRGGSGREEGRRARGKREAKEVSLSGENQHWQRLANHSPLQNISTSVSAFGWTHISNQPCVSLGSSASACLLLLVPSLIWGSVRMHNPECLDTWANCWTRWLKPQCCTQYDCRWPLRAWREYRSKYRQFLCCQGHYQHWSLLQ